MENDIQVPVVLADIAAESVEKSLKCGLIMPISRCDGLDPEHWQQVKEIICEALADTDFEVRLVSESDDVGVIHKSIVQNIYQNDIVVCDVSARNANVMFELGMRLAFDKPTVIIKDNETEFAFDTQIIEHVIYNRNLRYHDVLRFKENLKRKVLATHLKSEDPNYSTFLKHFTIDRVAKIEERVIGRDDYILDSINQMQRTIGQIASGLSGQDGQDNKYPYSKKDVIKLGSIAPVSFIDDIIRKFIYSYCAERKISPKDFNKYIREATDSDIDEITSTCSVFLKERYNTAMSNKDIRDLIVAHALVS